MVWPAANEGCCTLRCQWVKVASSSTVPTGANSKLPNGGRSSDFECSNTLSGSSLKYGGSKYEYCYPKMNIISNAAVILTKYNKQ